MTIECEGQTVKFSLLESLLKYRTTIRRRHTFRHNKPQHRHLIHCWFCLANAHTHTHAHLNQSMTDYEMISTLHDKDSLINPLQSDGRRETPVLLAISHPSLPHLTLPSKSQSAKPPRTKALMNERARQRSVLPFSLTLTARGQISAF